MDFNDFVVENLERYGLTEEEWKGLRKNVILTFLEEENGTVLAKYKGVAVFRHRDSEKEISPGDTWICSLDMSRENYYFAKGIQRIDSSFMYELKKDQIKEIADVIWGTQRIAIEPFLEEKYKEVIEEQLKHAVDDTKATYEEQIRAMRDDIHQLEQRDAENKQIITSLQEQIEAAKRKEDRTVATSKTDPADDSFGVRNTQVRREGPDTISSLFFSKSRYFVHLSADHRLLTIRPHENGIVICMNNTMVLAGLNLVSPFEGPCDMTSEYSPQYGGLKIYL